MLELYAAAPLQYRGLLVHVAIDGSSMHVNVPRGLTTNPNATKQLRADDWPTLRAKIDEELSR